MTKEQKKLLHSTLELTNSCRTNNIRFCNLPHPNLGMCTLNTYENSILIHRANTRWRSIYHFIKYSC